jgi:opacity protein-like surface antigen
VAAGAEPVAVSAASAAAHAYYAQVQQALLSQGLLRTDGGGADTPYTDRMLAETFVQIAMRDEYQPGTGGLVASAGAATTLRRWTGPVRVGLRFGVSVPADVQATDRARVGSYLARLAQVTGHPIRLDDANPNYFLYIVNEDERRALGPAMQAAMPGLGAADVAGMTQMPQSTYCAVLAQSRGQSGVYTRAFAVVRAEHPDLLRLSCIHEEVAQGLGLPNDSPRARPSIFNDDEEFALLTRMDEDMLRILYNPALRPGMTEDEVRPIILDLAARLAGGAS